MVVDRMPENEIEDYFYELSTYSMSLFKVGTMRTATKAKLKNFLLKMCLLPKLYQVLSALLLMEVHFYDFCKWKKNDRFGDVFQKYVDAVGKLGIDVVVFDGYAVSTKDCTHQKRTGKKLNIVHIREDNSCPAERELFFANYNNKKKLISELARTLDSKGVKVAMCSHNADTTILKVALHVEKASALLLTDGTDNLSLPIHHVDTSQKQHIHFKNMTRNANNERVCYRIYDLLII